ncbi:ORF6N domain-containing protein [Anatilimnocola floriformis]|uniref:ORF6N domain-containing protein n=1 Tax=Anatilimnocola floriformis TaxID=2948575 RepID=UPI0020C2BE98|nr:ORF6N domain-containing protein [Anatilimnocola floriformis]
MAKRKSAVAKVDVERVSRLIYIMRGQRVMLDVDLAKLYGVTVSALNQAVQRNIDRFPADFAHTLTSQELRDLKSQIVISKPEAASAKEVKAAGLESNKNPRGGRRTLPWVFTEHGVAMLSSVLRSPRAVQVNIEIVRAFVRLRRLLAAPGEFVEQLQQLAKTVDLHDEQIRAITQVLQQMMAPADDKTKEKLRIGFQAGAST